MSKTPKFDKAIDKILGDLVPHEGVCLGCNQKFQIEAGDIDFYKMLRVPPPTLCPKCRQIRRLGMLMRVPKFFKRPCTAPGHSESVVTVFPPSSPHKIYDLPFWYSDSWDPTSYGRSYDADRKFFEQFKEFFFDVPHIALERPVSTVNSEYSLGGMWGKNNYYTAGAFSSEDCSFGEEVRFSKYCVDCADVWYSEFCYACVCDDHCNKCVYVIDSNQCLDSAFLYDCKNCTNCFLSSNLRNKSYVFENKQLSREEYQSKISQINLGDRNVLQDMTHRFENVLKNALHRSVWLTNAVNCVGDRLVNCKNCFQSFDGNNGENFRFVQSFSGAKDSMDIVYSADNAERVYEAVMGTGGSDVFFSLYVRTGMYVEYSCECQNCQNCFGCVGLRNKKFHIFNKPYSEDEYWKLVDDIKSKMLNDGEYGELFPLSLGLYPYQASKVQKFYAISQKQAQEKQIPWYEEPESQVPEGMHLLNLQEVPDDIKNVEDSILASAIRCEVTGKPFKIVDHELKFYRHMNLPIPTKHPWQRIMERYTLGHPFDLFPFVCPNCGEKSLSIYNEAKQKELKIFCEKCYLKEVI